MNEKKIMALLLLVAAGLFIASFVIYSSNSGDSEVERGDDGGIEEEGNDNGIEEEGEESDVPEEDLTVSQLEDLIVCLNDADVVIYGTPTCPYCTKLVDSLGGSNVVEPIYVNCFEEEARCREEMKGRGVPEIQIEGEMYQGSRDPQDIASVVGCEI